jgi:hypothetical protein
MKLINIKQKYKSSLRLWVLWGSMLGLGACAYDPNDIAGSNSGEPQSRDLSDKLGSDLVISERVVLKSYPEKIRRLTILDGAVLATNGHPLSLDVEEIVSFNGRIDTTPNEPVPSAGGQGASGALFQLSAKRGRGYLHVMAGGQNGGIGAKGPTGETGGKGARGHAGKNDYQTDCLLSALSVLNREFPGRCFKNWYCSRQTGDGAQGGRGGTGKPGLQGGDGGNSSPVLIELEDPSGIIISTEVQVGKGGFGGPGGDGGLGGSGGAPGSRDSRKLCRSANRGPRGPRGNQGPLGPSGDDGKEQPICLRLGAAQIGDCRDFKEMTQRGVQ